ncbi:hypothetical protein F5Y06DRAFT_307361 [Hypoxylon sp. FL0890]|nr:hypothetical protein F5Y06DRAFT_307361 [Hypoxylon sp. FL0890]
MAGHPGSPGANIKQAKTQRSFPRVQARRRGVYRHLLANRYKRSAHLRKHRRRAKELRRLRRERETSQAIIENYVSQVQKLKNKINKDRQVTMKRIRECSQVARDEKGRADSAQEALEKIMEDYLSESTKVEDLTKKFDDLLRQNDDLLQENDDLHDYVDRYESRLKAEGLSLETFEDEMTGDGEEPEDEEMGDLQEASEEEEEYQSTSEEEDESDGNGSVFDPDDGKDGGSGDSYESDDDEWY